MVAAIVYYGLTLSVGQLATCMSTTSSAELSRFLPTCLRCLPRKS